MCGGRCITHPLLPYWRLHPVSRLAVHPSGAAQLPAPPRPHAWGPHDRNRTCGYARETPHHVLRHCLTRTTRLAPTPSCYHHLNIFDIAFENRPVEYTNLRPHLVLISGEEPIVIDATCPFENTPARFADVRRDKIKHEPVRVYLLRRYQ
ncbi:hypothetical protein MTO96_036985 [Rhipicephalus appendiculatus]